MRFSTQFALNTFFAISFCLLTPSAHTTPVATHTTPVAAADELEPQSDSRSLLSQINQARSQVGDRASTLVENAMGFLGVRYLRGGNSAETGFDCSGFVRATYEQTIGLLLPRRAEQQAAATEKIERSDLKPGDLVFFNTMRRAFSHVGIYVGNGQFIHAPRSGSEVRLESMTIGYWQSRFNGARRVAGEASAQTLQKLQSLAAAAAAPAAAANPLALPAPTGLPYSASAGDNANAR